MRKLILQEWITVDGYAADKNGGMDFFAQPELNKQSDEDIFAFLNGIDLILLGAKTYQIFVDYWPNANTNEEVMADKLNATPKIVFSKTLASAPWGRWPQATVVAGDAAAEVKRLKTLPGKDMVMWGSLSVAQTLMKAHLIDEYHVRVCPSVLGGGLELFKNVNLELELLDTKIYDTGMVFLKYRDKTLS